MSLEDELRGVLSDPRRALPAWPDAVSRVHEGMARRQRRRLLVAAATMTVAVVLVLTPAAVRRIAAPPTAPGPTPGVVPWAPAPASHPARVMPSVDQSTAAACVSGQLHPATWVNSFTSAPGSGEFIVRVVNQGARCTLGGPVELIATDAASGKRGVVPLRQQPPGDGSFVEYRGESARVYPATVERGEEAQLLLFTGFDCPRGIAPVTYRDVTLVVSGRHDRLSGLDLVTACPVYAGSGWFRHAPEARMPDPPLPGLRGLEATIEATGRFRRGAEADFVVRLTNQASSPVRLDPCPVYQIALGEMGADDQTHRLNCAVTQIESGESVRFAMRITIPTAHPPGPEVLIWMIIEPGGNSAIVRHTVQIE